MDGFGARGYAPRMTQVLDDLKADLASLDERVAKLRRHL
jgi:hypothetical protein